MATSTTQAKKNDDADLSDLKDQFDLLKIEMKAMTDMLGSTATSKAETIKDDAIAQMEHYGAEARARVSGLQTDAERAVVTNPLAAVAISAGIGFLIGALTRR